MTTTGQKPGTRDSHSAALVGRKMVVFGGTNGSKKVNDLHILDLQTKEWNKPNCKGILPSPRESHTATLVGDDKLVIFGGSGEGEANYLNDVHILDLKSMTWASPEVKGDPPAPRDSHTAVAIGNKLLIYGGDCGDRYHGEVDVLDLEAMSWSRVRITCHSCAFLLKFVLPFFRFYTIEISRVICDFSQAKRVFKNYASYALKKVIYVGIVCFFISYGCW